LRIPKWLRWSGSGVLGPEAFDAAPFLDALVAYGSPWGLREGAPQDILKGVGDILGGAMAKTLVDIDEQVLAAAMAEYGTTTKVETVNRALREVADRRQRAVDEFMEWALELSEALAECDVRALAWR
jgi:Arc/MetJ family transcription regulator